MCIITISGQLTIREAELAAVSEERDNARRDLSETHLAKDEIVKKAWELRDQAVQRKNKAEIEVARTRIDMMQVNSQLMEAIQQKIQLSQQLEQWQVRMYTRLYDIWDYKMMIMTFFNKKNQFIFQLAFFLVSSTLICKRIVTVAYSNFDYVG